ncbi:MAG: zinc-ribbon domain containing protein [Desulfobacterales bacterium]|nr:zinc-ribbon domain containing protein [Desulfobacterales bacterium]
MELENIAAYYCLFVDTCSIMHEKANDFFYRLAPILISFKKQIIIPNKVVIEIDRLRNNMKLVTRDAAIRGATILKDYKDYNLIDVRGEKSDPFADNVFLYVFSKFRTQYNLALLTQDKSLAMDILALKKSKAVQTSRKLLVLKLKRDGSISLWKDDYSSISNTKEPYTNTSITETKKFRLGLKPIPKKNHYLKTNEVPKEGDYIDADEFGRLRLKSIIGAGGEGKIFLTDSGFACKVYSKELLTENLFQKLALMVNSKIIINGVCWPVALAKNLHKEFVGYLMPLAQGSPMQKCMFVKPLLEKKFPHWSRKNLVQLSISWLEKVVELHDMNILLGDVNPLNFLIKSDQEIFFVDTDSYQIEDFPCPVGMANFTAPDIQGKNFSTFLRTFEHEYFAIATLLFMILLPGKPPYSHQGGGDLIKNIKEGVFSYPLGEKSNKKTPDGPWRFIWSHLPYKTKEAFYKCFVNKEMLNPAQWLDLMRSYKYALENGHLDPDGESDKLFPTRFKGVSTFAKEVFGAEDIGWEKFNCDKCGKTFQLNAEQANKMRNVPRKVCKDCYQLQKMENTTGEMIFCSNCGETFLFTISEKFFFNQKGFDKPKKCKKCRENRKESNSSSILLNSKTNRPASQSNDSLWVLFKDIFKSIFE